MNKTALYLDKELQRLMGLFKQKFLRNKTPRKGVERKVLAQAGARQMPIVTGILDILKVIPQKKKAG